MRADRIHRLLAKFIDLLIAGALWRIFPAPIGFLAATTYILIADGLPPKGQSLGKRLIGLRVVLTAGGADSNVCNWRGSIVRNVPFILAFFATGLGFIGVIFFIVGLVLMVFETYFVFTDPQGTRLGDIFASTKVLDA